MKHQKNSCVSLIHEIICIQKNKYVSHKFKVSSAIAMCCIVVLFIFTGCFTQKETVDDKYKMTFRLGESHPDDYPTTLADVFFADRVKELTEGRVTIIVYPNKVLGEEREVIEQVQFGAIGFARISIAPLSEFVPELNVLQLPYLYKNSDHMWKVLNSDIGDYFLKSVNKYGFVGITYFDGGARSFYNSVRPITKIEDLEGLKIRVMESSLMLDLVKTLGASGVQLPYGQVYSELQLGAIDGAENNFPSYESSAHFEIAKYYTMDEHVRVPEMILVNNDVFESILPKDREFIYQAAAEAQVYQRNLWTQSEEKSKAYVLAHGSIVNVLTDKEAFIQRAQPIYEPYMKKYGDIIREIQAIE